MRAIIETVFDIFTWRSHGGHSHMIRGDKSGSQFKLFQPPGCGAGAGSSFRPVPRALALCN